MTIKKAAVAAAFAAVAWSAAAQTAAPVGGGLKFDGVFAPGEGLVNRLEKPFREAVCLNGRWDFQADKTPEGWKHGKSPAPELTPPTADGWDPVKIKIPSPWNINDFVFRKLEGPDHRNYPSYPDSWTTVQMAWMRRKATVPAEWAGRDVALHFEAVAGESVVLVNGRKVAENFDLFLPFEANLAGVCKPGDEIEILVGVRSQRLFEDNTTVGRRIVPAGSMWGTAMNGIWQDVYLVSRPAVHVSDVYVKPLVSKGVLEVEVEVANAGAAEAEASLAANVYEWVNRAGTDVLSAPVPAWELGPELLKSAPAAVKVAPGAIAKAKFEIPVAEGALRLWTPEYPALNALTVTLSAGGKAADLKYERFGWREWTIVGAEHRLNGRPYQLRGDSWHFIGIPQMTRRYPWAWYTAIKAMNGNAVRLHAQVYPRFYHDLADEMGICILDETANWASDGGPKVDSPLFWEHSLDHLRRFIRRDRNHPSVFGWSVSNENKPVILNVFSRPDLMPQQKEAWVKWRDTVRELDPTRPWISSDGEEDGEGILPVTVGHYGDANSMRNWREIGKPWGIGETSMAYYGTPEQIAKVNGERAYESLEGRMEGLATECYGLIRDQRAASASYASVFNMAWYALKPLAFGKRDLTTPPAIEDGVWFGEYEEGRPGVQPERLGPYCSTFNPGYDPALPLWETWPMFDAMRAANAGSEPAWSRWAEVPAAAAPEWPAAPEFSDVVFFGPADGKLRAALDAQGVTFSDSPVKGAGVLAIVDASVAPKEEDLAALRDLRLSGAQLWVWGPTPETIGAYSPVTGQGIELKPLKRSTFLPRNKPLMGGLKNSDFYFCELQRADAASYVLGGSWVAAGESVLDVCPTDWRTWNKRAEETKTAAALRSERECPAERSVVAVNGRVTVLTLTDFMNSERGFKTMARVLRNAGVKCREIKEDPAETFFLRDGKINFPTVMRDRLKKAGDRWQLEFWVYSNRPLDDLLIEPNMPKLMLWTKGRQGASLKIGGKDVKVGWSNNHDIVEFKELPLKQGWNHLELEIGGAKHQIEAEFRCNNRPEFLNTVKASLTPKE